MADAKCLRCGADSSWLQGKVPDEVADCHGNCPEALGYATGVAAMRGERDNARAAALEEAAKIVEKHAEESCPHLIDESCCNSALRLAAAAIRAAIHPDPHNWIDPTELVRWPHCRACGVIKRTDGKNSPNCKGAPRITLRDAGMPFEQDTMTHEPNPPAERVTHAALFAAAGPILAGSVGVSRWDCVRCEGGPWYRFEDVPEFCEPRA